MKPSHLIFMISAMVAVGSLFGQSTENKPNYIKTDHSNQIWFTEILKEHPNYPLVDTLFNKYFVEHPLEKSQEKNRVRRWLMTASSMQDSLGNVYPIIVTPEDRLLIGVENEKAKRIFQKRQNANNRTTDNPPNATWNDSVGSWRMIGPYHISDREGVYNMYGGFNDRVFINWLNPSNMISGQSYGGLWTSQDAGVTWKLTDAEFENGTNEYSNRDMYYGDIEVHPANPNRILAGTHAGLLISDDGGESWSMADSLNQMDKPGERAYFVAQKPDDQNVIIANYGKRVFRSSNGGLSWTMVFDNSSVTHNFNQGQHSDQTVYQRRYNFAGIDFHPTDPNTVYISALNASNQVCLYKSINAGLSFTLLVNTGKSKFLKMMVSPADPSHVYFATLFTNVQSPATDDGIYKYNSSGTLVSFKPIQGITVSGLVDDVQISMTDANVWYMGGYAASAVHKSIDGGTNWSYYNTPGYDTGIDDYVHPDVRSIAVVGDTILVGTDGGLHKSYDGSLNFQSAGKWISAIDLWGFSSSYKGNVIASGDDHGPSEVRYDDVDRGWVPIGGADSGEIQVNNCNTDYAYGRDVYSRFMAVKTDDTTYVRNSNILIDAQFKYLAQDPDSYFAFYPCKNNVLKKSTDNMKTSVDLYSFTNNITKVEVALKNNQILFILENKNKIHKSTDGGISFMNITPPSSATNGKTLITDVEIDEYGTQIWLSYGESQTVCKVVYSNNGGATWSNITNGQLPSLPLEHITYQRGTNGMVYVAMKRQAGIWYKDNSMTGWAKLGFGLPMVSYITSIYTVPDCSKFRMGTSRGAFEHDLAVDSDVLAHFSVDKMTSNACYLDTSYFYDYSSYSGNNISFSWTFEGGSPSTSSQMNPKVVYLEPGIFDVTLVVTDGNGNSSTYHRSDFMAITAIKGCGPQPNRTKAQYATGQSMYTKTPPMGLTNSNHFTMMAWIRGDGPQVDYASILSHSLNNGSVVLNTRDVGADSTQIGYHFPGGQWWWNSNLYLKPNEWTHLALIVEPNGVSICKNGICKKHSFSLSAVDFINKGEIGSFVGAEWYRNFKGYIDEVAFYNRSLSESEIRQMMHLTKQNPKYPDQLDASLIAYYQYNDDNTNIVADVSGNGKNAEVIGSLQMVESNGPFGGGRSQSLNISTPGLYDYSDPGIKLEFQGVVPMGNVIVNHIESLPDVFPTNKKMHELGYYIINNYGNNANFSPILTFEFTKTGTISTEVQNTVSNYHFEILKRTSNMHLQPFTSVVNQSFSATAGAFGKVKANNASGISSFSQFILTRDAYPRDFPKVRMVSPSKSTKLLEGGESISLWIEGDYQGLLLPVLDSLQLQSAGSPSEGMMAYHQVLKKIIVFANNKWNVITAGPIFDLTNGTFTPNTNIQLGQNTASDISGIVQISEPGFIKLSSVTNLGLEDIKYPSKSLLIFNQDTKTIQCFSGGNWVNILAQSINLPISNAVPASIKGFTVGSSIQTPNAVLEDNDPTGGILIPSYRPEDIKDPAEGLMIYDNSRSYFFYFDGLYWNRIEME